MNDTCRCPVCLNASGDICRKVSLGPDPIGYDCEICGRYEITASTIPMLKPEAAKRRDAASEKPAQNRHWTLESGAYV